ncbi:MAG: hypothetical protein M3497_07085 [Gemmatimonadota bacterium]|jgi:hypothetical protein|nr:hypothetical protein [Gemmatimonadota bacterium]
MTDWRDEPLPGKGGTAGSTGRIVASSSPELQAWVVRRTALLYSGGADPTLDRPAYVRAASSLVRIGKYLAVIQDDANFVALMDERDQRVHPVTLPAGLDGKRQFDDLRGNKALKLDLEACTVVPAQGGDVLVAFGSGSLPLREQILVVHGIERGSPSVALYSASRLYAQLHAAKEFSGSELNLEGAVWMDGRIRLFNRGNGAPQAGLLPVDATCELEWDALWAHLQNPVSTPPPPLHRITQYTLGALEGMRLTFTDAALGPGGTLFFSATAEDSPDAVRDGPVAGSALGILVAPDRAEWAVLRNTDGTVFDGKVEGLLVGSPTPHGAYIVVDRDDPTQPSELCEVELAGAWYPDE